MTGFSSNINELIQRFEGIRDAPIDPTNALLAGVNAAKAAMQHRIFNQGKDAGGKSLGKYMGQKRGGMGGALTKKIFGLDQATKDRTVGFIDFTRRFTPHELKRLNAGRQVVYKDLELTGALRRGIVTVRQQNRVVCVIPHPDLYRIAKAQEDHLHTVIFALSEKERALMVQNTNAILKQEYDRVFKS